MYVLKLTFAILWCLPWGLVAIVLCLSIVGIPLGIVCWAIASAPWLALERSRIKKEVAHEMRDHPLHEGDVPWEI